MYCFLLHLHSVIYVSLVVLFLLCWLKVSYVLPWLMYGQESAGGRGGGGNYFRKYLWVRMCRWDPGTLEPLAYTRATSAEFCYPTPPPHPREAIFQILLRSLAQSSQNKTDF